MVTEITRQSEFFSLKIGFSLSWKELKRRSIPKKCEKKITCKPILVPTNEDINIVEMAFIVNRTSIVNHNSNQLEYHILTLYFLQYHQKGPIAKYKQKSKQSKAKKKLM